MSVNEGQAQSSLSVVTFENVVTFKNVVAFETVSASKAIL